MTVRLSERGGRACGVMFRGRSYTSLNGLLEIASMSQEKILIVDDNPLVQRGLSGRLRANRYKVNIASDGVSAIADAKQNKPDLILLDIGLPGENGFQVLERLKADEHLSSIPVMLLSGRAPQSNRTRALNGGAMNYLQKPVENGNLLAAVKRALLEN